MPLSSLQKKEILDLLLLSLEGMAEPHDMEILRDILNSSEQARDFYIQAVAVIENIRKMEWPPEQQDYEEGYRYALSQEFWRILTEEERNAPTIIIPKERSEDSIHKEFSPSRGKAQLSKFSLITFLISAAALILLMVIANFAPVDETEVATLKDSINVRWGATDVKLENGDRILSGSTYSLLGGGYVNLLFDNNADVTIEGPAEFEIVSDDRVKLHYGQIYSIVPQEAIGFSVATANAMVIDLGTQFGVQVDFRGNTELHVNKGKTMLISGQKKNKMSNQVLAGAAKKITASTMEVIDIPCEDESFVRHIDSQSNIIWRGQKSLDLTDIVCGGNGLGTGNVKNSIDPTTGKVGVCVEKDRYGQGEYVLVPELPFVDGVFVPNGNRQVISSNNHVFAECPLTNDIYYFDIHRGSENDRLELNSSEKSQASLLMHANVGITFDLDQIRSEYKISDITQFKSWFGISFRADRNPNADVCVLVDGQIRYTQKQIKQKGVPYPVQVDLEPADRFLTLIVTDGEDKDIQNVTLATDSDWGIFVNPELILSDKEK